MDLFAAKLALELTADLFDKVRGFGVGGGLDVQAERHRYRGFFLRARDLAVVTHFGEDEVAAAKGALGMVERRVVFRALGQSREEGGFGEGEVVDMFGEIELASGFESVGAVAQIDLVRVHGEDLVLGEDM